MTDIKGDKRQQLSLDNVKLICSETLTFKKKYQLFSIYSWDGEVVRGERCEGGNEREGRER